MEKDDLIRSIQNRIERIERRLKNIDDLFGEVKNEMFALYSEIVVLNMKKRRREKKDAKTRRS